MTASLVSTGQRTQTGLIGGLRYVPAVALGLDLVMISIAVFVAVVAGDAIPLSAMTASYMGAQLEVAGPVMILGWVAVITAMGGYRKQVFGASIDEYKRVIDRSMATAALVGIACYLAKFPLSRGFFVLTFAVGIPLLGLGRFLLRRSVHRARKHGALLHRVVDRGLGGTRRRDRQRPTAGVVARLQRDRRARPRPR